MAKPLLPAAQKGVGIRLAHDPGDPLITSHCPFCGSGQVVGRSDGTISCDFCGQVYIVRVQPAFPGMPQAPMGPGAPSDIGPDGGVLPPDAIGPDGLPMGGEDPAMDEGMEDAEAPPFGAEGDAEGDEDEGFSGPPGAADEDDSGDAPPPPKKKGKGDSKKKGVRTYRGLDGQVLTEGQYVRHLAVVASGGNPAVLAQLRTEARERGNPYPVPWPTGEDVAGHLARFHPEVHPMPATREQALTAHHTVHEHVGDLLNHVHSDTGGEAA